MYRAESPAVAIAAPIERSRPRAARVSSTVLALGAVSLLTDISSEMVAAILPLYLTTTVGLSPLAFGLTDGLYQGVTVLVRLLGGWWSDRAGRSKLVCLVGYGMSAVAKPFYLIASGVAGISSIVAFDRFGKGLRTAPRDAMIVAAEPTHRLGRAFGIHRAMDTIGAMAGPLLAFWMLSVVPRGYRPIFIVSACIAIIGVGVLWAFVPGRAAPVVRAEPRTRRRALVPPERSRHFRRLLVVAGALSVVTVSDGFVFLVLQTRTDMDTRLFPLLFLGTAMAYFALSIPTGMLADRFGARTVYLAGHTLLIVVYMLLMRASGAGTTFVLVTIGLLGAYYACTDGVLAALVGSIAPAESRATYLGATQTVVASGRLVSSLAFGALWPGRDDQTGLLWFAWGMAGAIALALFFLPSLVPASADDEER